MLGALCLALPVGCSGGCATGEPGEPGEPDGSSAPGDSFSPVVRLELVAEGLVAPVALEPAPDDTERLFVADQIGTIHVIGADGELLEEPFLDLRDKIVELDDSYDERGLLGLAFHPNYAQNGRLFVYYSAPLRPEAPEGFDHTSHVAEYRVSADDPNRADPESEELLLQMDQPQTNHNAGQITFGPDGYLYIPVGDGGGANDTGLGHVEDWYEDNEGGNGQDIHQNLLGSILRVDVDGGDPYAIPSDNPFVGDAQVPDEIWAYGLRNPFKISFDSAGQRELFVGDVGQELWEEVDIVEAGGNYGWNVKEGTHCFSTAHPFEPPSSCPDTGSRGEPLIDPIIELKNSKQDDGLISAVVGGHVYRGEALAGFEGRYIFGGFSAASSDGHHGGGMLLVASRPEQPDELWPTQKLKISKHEHGDLDTFVLSFGRDHEGELYLLSSNTHGPSGDTGKVYRLAAPD